MLKKFSSDKINRTKNTLSILSQAPTHHSFTFNLRFSCELKHKVPLFKTVCGIFHFWFRFVFFVFIKVYVLVQQNPWTLWLWNFIIPFKIKVIKIKAAHSFAPRPLIFKLKQEVLKFNDIYMSWSSPKIDLETNFLDLENRSFENVSFSQ